ncbi:MAG: hypothetical protein ABJF50_15185 [Paracoccaceae bacterium]
MKVMLSAFVAMAVIAVGSSLVLDNAGFSAQEQTSGASVRLD